MEALRRSICRRGMPDTLARLMREGYRLPENAYQSKGPLMLIWGTNDRIFGGQLPARVKKRLPDAETHMLRAAHMSMETDADILNDYLARLVPLLRGTGKMAGEKARRFTEEALTTNAR